MTETWFSHKHRTANDGITFEGEASGGGGGGSGGVQVVTVPVSSAQILDLFNTPVTLIPGVAGNVIVVTGFNIAYLAGLVPYLDGGGQIIARYSGGVGPFPLAAGAGFWDQATSQDYALGYGTTSVDDALSVFDGMDLVLSEDTASPTLGDGTLKVTLSYFLAPVV